MPKIAKLISITAALFALLAAQAGAVDLRSPDAVDAARQALAAQQSQNQDLRSPDAVDAANTVLRGETVSTYSQGSRPESSDSDFLGYVALGIALTIGTTAVVVMTRQRRRRRSTGQLVGARS